MLSFIIPIYVDNIERHINLQNCIKYYSTFLKGIIDTEIILVESNKQQFTFNENLKYIFFTNNDQAYRKTLSYNIGTKIASGDIFCFLDADIFVNPEAIINVVNELKKNRGISLGYNGVAVYTTKNGKDEIVNKITENWCNVRNCIDFSNIRTGYATEKYVIGNTKAVGGCLLSDRKTFYEIGGFNPNFIGWGYEDNEIISRARILEIPIFAPSCNNDVLIHAWHDIQNTDKSKHPHYSNNEQEVRKVESMNKHQLKEYIKTWNV